MSNTQSPHHLTEKLDELYEFDREPVTANKLCSAGYFAASYAGEHIAATEFVIGALFVSWGASVFDIFVGLLLGNLLAVLSWALICAPIAVRTRLTLYWFIHKVGGPYLAFVYNISNALLYCVLAGTMVTVSAASLRIPFGIPSQTLWYPTDWRFVLIVLLAGGIMIYFAILGFKRFAQFSAVCSPWMITMFLVGGLMSLAFLANYDGNGRVTSFSHFWSLASKYVWTGSPLIAEEKLGFWHIVAFAWICNLAMHFGLSDMAVFRYAKKAYYGLNTWTGMFIGHYVAWICAGMLGACAALMLNTSITKLDSGDIGYVVLGFCGPIAVLLSGLTTAIPTLYKAGLGLQSVTPNWPRWAVTFVAGAVTTIIACFPFVFAQMLRFIGLYGLLLLPIGAVAFTEFWIFPKIGLTRYWVSHRKMLVNWPALATWVVTIGVSMILWANNTIHLFFLFIPVWFVSVAMYICLAYLAGAKMQGIEDTEIDHRGGIVQAEPVKAAANTAQKSSLFKLIGFIALGSLLITLLLPLKVLFAGKTEFDAVFASVRSLLIWPTIAYFVFGTIWYIRYERNKTV
jgi:NCS1 family nucleobase:cation symporter-1